MNKMNKMVNKPIIKLIDLPVDIIGEIVNYLTIKEIWDIYKINKLFYNMPLLYTDYFWKRIIKYETKYQTIREYLSSITIKHEKSAISIPRRQGENVDNIHFYKKCSKIIYKLDTSN
tara:strand:+ start:950 stop:1300 length:351 start_codon:yes stop_codon:yes gene_type:complete